MTLAGQERECLCRSCSDHCVAEDDSEYCADCTYAAIVGAEPCH